MQGLRSKYEEHHGVTISDDALEAATDYAIRYINDRFLPDKAIDLIDEAASRKKLGILQEIRRRRRQKRHAIIWKRRWRLRLQRAISKRHRH